MHYLDNAATTKPYPEVVQCMAQVQQECFANPSALYAPGMQAQQRMEQSAQVLAEALGCSADEVVFTAGGTEGNNLALLGAAAARGAWGNHMVVTGYEHPSVQNTLARLAQRQNLQLTTVAPGKNGVVDVERMMGAVTGKTMLVAAMQLNNETGALLDVGRLAAAVKQRNPRTAVHVDGVQAFTKVPLALGETAIDSYTVSAHKLHGPKGVGALYLRKGYNWLAPFAGGGQQGGRRPGTENTPGVAGFAKAAAMATANRAQNEARLQRLGEMLQNGVAEMPGVAVNSPPGHWPGLLNISFATAAAIPSQPLLNFLAERDVYVASGSSCDRGKPSHTLQAMGLPKERVNSALRISLSAENSDEDVQALLAALREARAHWPL